MKRLVLPRSTPRSSGFSLIELLVAIAVMAILAAILLPAVSRARLSATKGKDVSNMRQIGTALNLYLVDNNNLLPVSWVSFPANPRVQPAGEYQPLSGHLAPYLDTSIQPEANSGGEKVFIESLLSPAWPEAPSPAEMAANDAPNVNSYRLVLGGLGKTNPFGGKETNSRGEEVHEQSIYNLINVFDLDNSEFPILYNHDQGLPFSQPGAPEQPFYGEGRNVLYLDGHVTFETDLEFLDGFR